MSKQRRQNSDEEPPEVEETVTDSSEPEVMTATITDVSVDAPFADDLAVAEGDFIRNLEWYFPLIWLGMLIIVSYIGIFYAVDHLPGGNPLPPSFQF